ncbi:Hypothetical protein ORPV_570 [Orpheovirus IHUMI-LCC2]|uniref:Uncharacterized protein n=1 Tax=Orpheovirus IHUMI-LCC2 TaxID=2023057 RepID=A0A2I2L4L9_9VIRU|nr:Hypothetical protein ORPV_570 [Orpheovirus IHUMI-LCC2]SNW62474.1 Hypothetical protein ORPV_570 [Orpheovirus IHUMI-LCC2]
MVYIRIVNRYNGDERYIEIREKNPVNIKEIIFSYLRREKLWKVKRREDITDIFTNRISNIPELISINEGDEFYVQINKYEKKMNKKRNKIGKTSSGTHKWTEGSFVLFSGINL